MDENVLDNIKSESRWLRLFFMAVYYMAFYFFAGLIVLFVASIQIVYGFIKGEPNQRLLMLTSGLNSYIHQILQYITYNSDIKPYPFSDWPSDDIEPSDKYENKDKGSE